MSTKPGGAGAHHCDCCGRSATWGCGHSFSQERDARRHNLTKKHAERRCMCYGHDHCDRKTCELAGKRTVGYMPFHQHTPNPSTLWDVHINTDVNGEVVTETRQLVVPDAESMADVRLVYAVASEKWGIDEDKMLAVPHRS